MAIYEYTALAKDFDKLRHEHKAQGEDPLKVEGLILGLLTFLRTERDDPDNNEIDQYYPNAPGALDALRGIKRN